MIEPFHEAILLVILAIALYAKAADQIDWTHPQQKRTVGPHVLVRKRKQFSYNGEKRSHCWECKYCERWSAEPDSIRFTAFACEEFRQDGGPKEEQR
jgi:hypothetical protein